MASSRCVTASWGPTAGELDPVFLCSLRIATLYDQDAALLAHGDVVIEYTERYFITR